jgi:hypothetical protein
MNCKFIPFALCSALLAGCGGTSGGPTITDGSGNPVHIGIPADRAGGNASYGPGHPEWPREPATSGR